MVQHSGGTHNSNTWVKTQANRCVGQVNVLDNTANNFRSQAFKWKVGDGGEFETVNKNLRVVFHQIHFNYDTAVINGGASCNKFEGGLIQWFW